jgi:TolA-binding protein
LTESELEELLDAERDIEAPPEDARSRMFARLAPIMIPAVIGAGVAGSSGAGTALSGNATGVVGSSLKVKLLIAAIAGAVGAIGGATTHAALTRAREKGTAAASVSAIGRSEPPAPVRSEPSPQPSEVTDAPAEATPSTSAPTRAAGNGPATLLNERLLLERASAALMRGDSSAALQALREHARRFPRGELAEERQVLMIRALRAAGQDEAAEKVSKDFKSKFPSSLDQGTIEETPSSK